MVVVGRREGRQAGERGKSKRIASHQFINTVGKPQSIGWQALDSKVREPENLSLKLEDYVSFSDFQVLFFLNSRIDFFESSISQ